MSFYLDGAFRTDHILRDTLFMCRYLGVETYKREDMFHGIWNQVDRPRFWKSFEECFLRKKP